MKKVARAELRKTEFGLVPEGGGWFILNTADAAWWKNDKFGNVVRFEGEERFPQLGIVIRVLEPGQPNCHYHSEEQQEDFLVLSGECIAIVDGKEYPMKAWDFLHCPPGVGHVFVGAGSGPCALLMVGARADGGILYPVDDMAKKYGATATKETRSRDESYADRPKWQRSRARWPIDKK